jgi:hypothetical protein
MSETIFLGHFLYDTSLEINLLETEAYFVTIRRKFYSILGAREYIS